MKRSILVSVFVALSLFVIAGVVGGPSDRPARAEAAFPGADNIFVVSRQCLGNNLVAVTVSWTPSGQGSQFVDVGRIGGGFFFGSFSGAGPFSPFMNSLTIQGLQANSVFFLRVNTLTSFGFFPSPTVQIFTDCQFFTPQVFFAPTVFVQPPFVRLPMVFVQTPFALVPMVRQCFGTSIQFDPLHGTICF